MRTKRKKAALIATVLIAGFPVVSATAVTPNAHYQTTTKIYAAESAPLDAAPAYYHDM